MATRREKINKSLIDGLKPIAGQELFIVDTELDGFGFRLMPSGAGSYFIRYATNNGPRRRFARMKVAGAVAAPEEARKKAKRLLAEIALGADPSTEKKAAREAQTVAQLCDDYLEAARAGLVKTRFGRPKRPSTIAIDEGRIAWHIKPTIGGMIADKLTRADVQRMADSITAGKTAGNRKTKARGVARVAGGAGTAARVVELLGGIYTWAERRGIVSGANPARGVEKFKGEAKETFLDDKALSALGAAAKQARNTSPMAADAIILIALTGLRADEAAALRWDEIDADNQCLRLAQTKTGRSTRPLGATALRHLRALPRQHKEFVFPNRMGTGRAEMKTTIGKIFDAAGLHAERAQTLRRTFASVAADEGYSDATVGELLGHARRGVTSRHYIRRPDAALVAAADTVSARIAAAMGIMPS